MPSSHILIVNARKVSQPVFVIGAPHSGAEAIGQALKISPGFHVTLGARSVLQAVYAFARRPSLYASHGDATVAVMRDAFAQAWQIHPVNCMECAPQCRSAAGLSESQPGACAEERGLARYGDATPDLAYCAEALIAAFPDARIVQIVRDGRDSVAAMLTDPATMQWFRPGIANVDSEFPNPFYGVEDSDDRMIWSGLSDAAKCALRWRGAVRLAARLRQALPADQLKTLRYEDMIRNPRDAAGSLTAFAGTTVAAPIMSNHREVRKQAGTWYQSLTLSELSDIEKIAGEELGRLGYS
ncbi:MAG TPA: sulfotransferase [Trebonia sp.]|jgi:hypothetical protein|nr:sulfotransferase [Trebonia sp.]